MSALALFSWHPTLMVLAFPFLMVQAIIVFSPFSSLVRNSSRKNKTFWHWLLMLSALFCSLLGYLVIYVNKERSQKPHLTSWHAWFGLVTVVYTALQCLGGVLLWWGRASLLRWFPLSTWKLNHATSGLLLFIMATSSMVSGMCTSWFVSVVEGTSWYACVCCPLVLLLVLTNQLRSSYFYVFNNDTADGSVCGEGDVRRKKSHVECGKKVKDESNSKKINGKGSKKVSKRSSA